jgi:hypothetical protein
MVQKKLVELQLQCTLSTEGQSVTFVYVDEQKVGLMYKIQHLMLEVIQVLYCATGGTITTSGIIKFIHLQDQELLLFLLFPNCCK